jgi:hypothetical protein
LHHAVSRYLVNLVIFPSFAIRAPMFQQVQLLAMPEFFSTQGATENISLPALAPAR